MRVKDLFVCPFTMEDSTVRFFGYRTHFTQTNTMNVVVMVLVVSLNMLVTPCRGYLAISSRVHRRSLVCRYSSPPSKENVEGTSQLFHNTTVEPRYAKTYRLDGIGKQSRVESTTNTGHTLRTDVPTKMGGTDTAPQPIETLLTAWMGCTQATAVYVGRQMKPRLIIDSLHFEGIEAVRDERGALSLPIEGTPLIPSRLQRVTGTIRVAIRGGNSGISNHQLELLKEQTEIRCPVANMMISSGCRMDVEWTTSTERE